MKWKYFEFEWNFGKEKFGCKLWNKFDHKIQIHPLKNNNWIGDWMKDKLKDYQFAGLNYCYLLQCK